jgi:hypothetical protein
MAVRDALGMRVSLLPRERVAAPPPDGTKVACAVLTALLGAREELADEESVGEG